MSILTADLIEINQDRAARREALAAERPTTQSKKSKWRDIEDKMFVREMKSLKRANMAIG